MSTSPVLIYDLCRILVAGSLLVPCSLPGPPVVNVFSPLWPGKAGWSLASQRWLEVNDFGRPVNRYGRRQWHPTPVLLPGGSHGRRSLVGYSPRGRKESDTTEQLDFTSKLTYWKRPWCWERLKAGGEGNDRGWDGWMASPTQQTLVWINSRSWWRPHSGSFPHSGFPTEI